MKHPREIPSTVLDKQSWVDLRNIDQNGVGLTPWEVEFVESLTKQLLQGRTLTVKQRARLSALEKDRITS